MKALVATFGLVALSGCGEMAEARVHGPTHDRAQDAARSQVRQLFARGPEGQAELAALLRHPEVTGAHLETIWSELYSRNARGVSADGLEVLVEPLVVLAEDVSRTHADRRSALAGLRELGLRATPVAGRVWPLLDDEELFTAAWGVLTAQRWDPLIDVLIRTLESEHDAYQFTAIIDLGRFGPQAARAVPALSALLLGDRPFEHRELLFEALQKIGTPAARGALVAALDSPRWLDVKRACLAVLELSLFEAEPVLRRVAQHHWRSGIRRLAEVVADVLGRRRRGDPPQTNRIKFGTPCFKDGSTEAVVRLGARELQIPPVREGRPPVRPSDLPSSVDFGEDDECVRDFVRLDDGWAVAMNCGEWGGSILFVAADGRTRVLSPMHSDQFARLGDRVFAAGGLSHMLTNRGNIVELVRKSDGAWSAQEFAQPIGAPRARLLSDDGWILVGEDGATVLRPDGTQEEVECVVPK